MLNQNKKFTFLFANFAKKLHTAIFLHKHVSLREASLINPDINYCAATL